MSKKNQFLCILAILLATCFSVSSCIKDEHDETKGLSVGDKLPDFVVKGFVSDRSDWRYDDASEGMTTASLTTDAFAGKIGIIVFFNTDCEDCQKELPELQKVYDEIKGDSSYQFICIAREEDDSDIKAYWSANNLTLPYSPQADRSVYNLFAQTIIPRIYIINRQGIITAIHTDSPLATASLLLQDLQH